VSLDIGTLTLYTGSGPTANIRIDSRPNKPGGDEFLCCTNSGVRRPCRELKTVRRQGSGTRGHCVLVEVLQ